MAWLPTSSQYGACRRRFSARSPGSQYYLR